MGLSIWFDVYARLTVLFSMNPHLAALKLKEWFADDNGTTNMSEQCSKWRYPLPPIFSQRNNAKHDQKLTRTINYLLKCPHWVVFPHLFRHCVKWTRFCISFPDDIMHSTNYCVLTVFLRFYQPIILFHIVLAAILDSKASRKLLS
jgi:hypothetical protein